MDRLPAPWDHRRVRSEPWDDAVKHLADLADQVDATHERVVLTRDGRPDLVLLSADDLASLEETVFWQRDETDRAVDGEPPGDGEAPPGLIEADTRVKYAHLLHHRDSA
jgi:prevent-host-death family protein